MASHAKSRYGLSSQTPFSLSVSHNFCTATYCNAHAIAIPDAFKQALNKHHDSIKLIDCWLLAAAPWLVGSGECVSGLEQWPFALQGSALTTADPVCALPSSRCYESASQLPAGGRWLTGTSPFFQDQPLLASDEPTVLGLLPPAFPASLTESSWTLPNPRFMRFGTLCSSGAGAPSDTHCCIQVEQQPQRGLGQKLAHKVLFKF